MTLQQLKCVLQLDGFLRDPHRRNTHESLATALDRENAVDPRIIRKDLSFLKKDCGAPIEAISSSYPSRCAGQFNGVFSFRNSLFSFWGKLEIFRILIPFGKILKNCGGRS